MVLDGVGQRGAQKNERPAYLQPDKKEGYRGKRSVDGVVVGDPNLQKNVELLDQEPADGCEKSAGESRACFHFDMREKEVHEQQGDDNKKKGHQFDQGGGNPGNGQHRADMGHDGFVDQHSLGGKGNVEGNGQKDQQGQVIHDPAKEGSPLMGMPDGVHGIFNRGQHEQDDDNQADNAHQPKCGKIRPFNVIKKDVDGVVKMHGQRIGRQFIVRSWSGLARVRISGRRAVLGRGGHGQVIGGLGLRVQLIDEPDRGLVELTGAAKPFEHRGAQGQHGHEREDNGKRQG